METLESEDINITCKNNIIDSNNINDIDSNDLIKLCKIIESLENSHHIEIAKILKTNNVYLNENSNGIFVNLNKISFDVYNSICNYNHNHSSHFCGQQTYC